MADLTYPISNRDAYQSRIRFTVKTPINITEAASELLKAPVIPPKDIANDPRAAAAFEAQEKERRLNNLIQAGPTYEVPTDKDEVSLFVPVALQFNDGVNYNNINLGVIGGDAVAAVAAGKNLGRAGLEAIGKTTSSMVQLFQSGLDLGEEIGQVAAARFTPTQTGKNVAQLVGQATTNPNTRTLFQNVNIRQFNFTFKMIPTSREESESIEAIVKLFRTEMYPDLIALNAGYRFPNAFGIHVSHKGLDAKFQKVPDCFLMAVDTVYNSTSGVFHADGYPSEVDMTLRFTEMRQMNKADVKLGF